MGMDTYEWQKNEAVTKRLYYTEKTLIGTTMFSAFYFFSSMVVRKHNLGPGGKTWPVLKWYGIINASVAYLLLAPLTSFEIEQAWRKRVLLGKYIYTLYHIETPEQMAENKKNGNHFA